MTRLSLSTPATPAAPRVPGWIPSDYGLLTWSCDPAVASTGGTALTSGVLNLARVHLPSAATVTNILMYVNTAGATLTSGQCKAALYTAAGSLLSSTADQATAWGSTQLKTMPLTAAQSVAAGDYYVGFWSNGTTNPQFLRGPAINAVLANFSLAAASSRFATANTGVTTTAPATLGTLSGIASYWWVALS